MSIADIMGHQWRWVAVALLVVLAVWLGACAPASLVEVNPPSGVVDQSVAATPAGAMQLQNYALFKIADEVGGESVDFVTSTGVMTDELMCSTTCGSTNKCLDALVSDASGCGAGSVFFNLLNQPRATARQAREALALYAPTTPRAWQGRLYALEAYMVVMLADLYCSGIPLSTVSFSGVATPTAGLTTTELYTTAAALFDSALTLSADTLRFVNLAKVGKARALLALGKFTESAAAVQGVSTDFVYPLIYGSASPSNVYGRLPRTYFVQDNEGVNGLVWSNDPRTAIMITPTLSSAMPYSAKYSRTSAGVLDPTQTIPDNSIWLASGVEARLIEAEADLATGGSNWLAILNILRATCIGTATCAPVPGLTITNLPPLTDPGTADTRLSMLMRERAMWLFFTGHREGDLRRMARVYQRAKETLWPTGTYVNAGFAPLVAGSSLNGTAYSDGIVLSPEGPFGKESSANPLYTGCFDYDP